MPPLTLAALDLMPPIGLSADRIVVYANKSAADLLGWPTRDHGIGVDGLPALAVGDQARIVEVLDKGRQPIQILRNYSVLTVTLKAIEVASAGVWVQRDGKILRLGTFVPAREAPSDEMLVAYLERARIALLAAGFID